MIDLPGQGQDRAAKARESLQRKFLDLAGGDLQRAVELKREHYRALQRRSAAKRRQRRALEDARWARELEELGLHLVREEELLALLRSFRMPSARSDPDPSG